MLESSESLFLHQKQRDNQDRGKRKVKRRVIEVSNQVDFIFFFIWQAIVRGQLFLQKTFFLFIPSLTAPPVEPQQVLLSYNSYKYIAANHLTISLYQSIVILNTT